MTRRVLSIAGVSLVVLMLALALTGSRRTESVLLTCTGAVGLLAMLVSFQWGRSERALREARAAQEAGSAQLEQMFSGSRTGLVIADEHGALLRVNAAFCRLLGRAEQELLECAVDDFTHPDDREVTIRALEELRAGGTSTEYQKRYIRPDGREIWARVTLSITADPRTGERLILGQVQNVDERKRAELALAAERRLLDVFMAGIPEQVYFKDRDSRFLRVSDVQAQRLGFERPEELIGMTDFDVFGDEHARAARADELRVMETGQPIIDLEEREIYRPTPGSDDGEREPGWVLTTKLPLRDTSGEIVGTFGISRDITLRKRAEAALSESEGRWRALLDHLREIVVLADAQGRLTYATPSMERWLGYHPEELVGVDLASTGHPDDVGIMTDAFKRLNPDESVSLRHRVRHKDGSWHTLESVLIDLRANPTVGAVLFASTDVTDAVRLEEERERLDLERRVSHRLEAVGQLAAGIAHEINTPLQFVGDSITFLKDAVEELLILTGRYRELLWIDTPVPVEQRRAIMSEAEEHADVEYLCERIPAAFERTVEGIGRVRSIVQAMKRFSHPSSGEIVPEDLNDAIETTLAVCRNEYKYVAEVALELGELPSVPCNIGEINQVLLNLIVNAAQAIEEQRTAAGDGDAPLGRIGISTRVEGEHAVVAIADDGPGIPEQLLERIYEPFFTTKEVGKGTGQGLALARATIDRHGGALECASTPGAGTTFTIRLPLQVAGAEPAPLDVAA